jgi:hypothetical protein
MTTAKQSAQSARNIAGAFIDYAQIVEGGCWSDGVIVVQMAGAPVPVVAWADYWYVTDGIDYSPQYDTAAQAVASWNAAHGWPLKSLDVMT